MTETAERIRVAIEASGKTQREIAQLAGITEITLSRYVNGSREPRAMILEKILSACDAKKVCILTEDEAYAVAELIECNLYDTIRNDDSIDSMEWLRNILHAYEKLCRASGYVGLTEHEEGEGCF